MDINILFSKFPVLETERLKLKQIEIDDHESLLSILNDPDVVSNINYGKTFDSYDIYETIIDFYPNLFKTKKGIVWGMYLKPINKLIGLRMCFIDNPNEPVEIQGMILNEFRQNKLTLEAYIEIIKFLKKAQVEEINANCNLNNIQALGLLKKLGFEKVYLGLVSFHKPKAISFYKDLTIENTKLFRSDYTQSPNNFDDAYDLANKMYAENELAFAEEYINTSIELQPSNTKAYLLKAKISKSLRGNIPAIKDYEDALAIDIKLIEAYRELGICQYNLGLHDEAHKNWEIADKLGDEKSKEFIKKYPLQY